MENRPGTAPNQPANVTRHIRIPPALVDAHLTDGAFKMAVVLADYADANGICWPSLRTLARRCGCHYDTARRRIDELEKAELIRRTPRTKDGRLIPSLITCLWVRSVGAAAHMGVGAAAQGIPAPAHREELTHRTNQLKPFTVSKDGY